MVNLYAARHRLPVPALARWLLALGIVATLAANMAQGWSHGPVGAVIAAWPAVSLVGSYELLVWIIRTTAAGGLARGPAADHTGWYADHPAHGRPGASLPEATPDNGVARVGLVPACGNGPQVQTRGPVADQRSGPGQAAAPDHAGQDADQIRAGSGQAGTGRDESETIAAAVVAYRASPGRAGRCRSASWRVCSARPLAAGRAAAWPKPGRAWYLRREVHLVVRAGSP